MLLVEKTRQRFGYNGAFGPSSLKRVVAQCDTCRGERITHARNSDKPCKGCARKRGGSRLYSSSTGLVSTLLRAATIEAFGYDPTRLSKASSRRVLRKCICGEVSTVPFRQSSLLCISCAVAFRWNERKEKNSKLGLSSRGIPVEELRARSRRVKNGYKPTTELRKLASLLRAKLIGSFRTGYSVRAFSFSGTELRNHVRVLLEKFNHQCPNCGNSLREGFDLDHVVELSTATDRHSLLKLFSLDNISPLCKRCNRARGRKTAEYIKSHKGGSEVPLMAIGLA